jgi:hypothetical protein
MRVAHADIDLYRGKDTKKKLFLHEKFYVILSVVPIQHGCIPG